jgi:Rieske 2Fe-2S family protein
VHVPRLDLRLDGALIAAPEPDQDAGHRPDRVRPGHGGHLREWLGYAWVCLADEPPSFEDEVIGAADERLGGSDVIGGWQVDELAVGRRITYDVKANWKLIIENFMECYHCATIHPELTEMLPEFAQGNAARCSSVTAPSSPRTRTASPWTAARATPRSRALTPTTTGGTTRSP